MKPKNYSSEGIVLKSVKYGEADRIVTILSKKYGKIVYIAKGVRKLKSKKRGSLEVFSYIKFSASDTKTLDIITEVENIDPFKKTRQDLKKAAVSYFFIETVDKLTKDEEKNELLFHALLEYLKTVEKETRLKRLRSEFIEEILVLLGFWPLGKKIAYPDKFLESVTERQIGSFRVGKKITS